MGMLGLHFALTDDELSKLRSVATNEQAEFVTENFEVEKFGTPDCCETDKSWTYIHSAFNGTDPDGPLEIGRDQIGEAKFAIMGHSPILVADDDYIGLVVTERVEGVAAALETIKIDSLGQMVGQMHRKYGASGSADDAAEYAMSWYDNLVRFYRHAADTKKNVIFSVSY